LKLKQIGRTRIGVALSVAGRSKRMVVGADEEVGHG